MRWWCVALEKVAIAQRFGQARGLARPRGGILPLQAGPSRVVMGTKCLAVVRHCNELRIGQLSVLVRNTPNILLGSYRTEKVPAQQIAHRILGKHKMSTGTLF